jgi:hypothetical protein
MIWWKRAILTTGVLIVFTIALAWFMEGNISEKSSAFQGGGSKGEFIGQTCGQILGFGTALVWFLAFVFRKKP